MVSTNKPVRLNVRVSSVPNPEIKWFKDWYPLAESSRIKFVYDPPCMYSLIINDPILRDSGVYTCVAMNEGGKTSSTASLTVEGKQIQIHKFNVSKIPRDSRNMS